MASTDVRQAFTPALGLFSLTWNSFLSSHSLFLYSCWSIIKHLLFSLFYTEEDSFLTLDHSGILSTEFVSILQATEFTILISAYPVPKVSWLKDGKELPENYYVFTKTSHSEGNR